MALTALVVSPVGDLVVPSQERELLRLAIAASFTMFGGAGVVLMVW